MSGAMTRANGRSHNLTECGLPGIRQLPYGVHMCHLYRDRKELMAALVGYFAAGLRNHERCLWVSSMPVACADARRAIFAADEDADAAVARGQLSIVSDSEWFLRGGSLSSGDVCALWLAEEEKALAKGYRGLRIGGNAGFVTPQTWSAFMDYEQACHHAFRGRRIVALCCYAKESCGAAEVFELMRRHSCALEHPDKGWQVLIDPA
jgi:hypothetical protein